MPNTLLKMSKGVDFNKLIMLFFMAILLLNFPLLQVFGKDGSILGIPILFFYLFTIWLLIIFLILWFSRKK